MFVCMCVGSCDRVCVLVFVDMSMCLSLCVSVFVCSCVSLCMCMFVCSCVFVCMFVNVHVLVCACVYTLITSAPDNGDELSLECWPANLSLFPP
jgi:hypothetical protein